MITWTKKIYSGYIRNAFKLTSLALYNGTIFPASLLIRILRQFSTKISYGHMTKIPRDDGLLSEPTTEVNENNP